MRGGYNNAPTVYFDNIFADIEGVETLTPKEVTTQTPLTDVENHKGVEPEPRRGWAGTTKGLGVQPPIEIEEKKRSSLGGALRPAHSAARRRTPTPQEETGKDAKAHRHISATVGHKPRRCGEHSPLSR